MWSLGHRNLRVKVYRVQDLEARVWSSPIKPSLRIDVATFNAMPLLETCVRREPVSDARSHREEL
jgi:hypothetical protein